MNEDIGPYPQPQEFGEWPKITPERLREIAATAFLAGFARSTDTGFDGSMLKWPGETVDDESDVTLDDLRERFDQWVQGSLPDYVRSPDLPEELRP